MLSHSVRGKDCCCWRSPENLPKFALSVISFFHSSPFCLAVLLSLHFPGLLQFLYLTVSPYHHLMWWGTASLRQLFTFIAGWVLGFQVLLMPVRLIPGPSREETLIDPLHSIQAYDWGFHGSTILCSPVAQDGFIQKTPASLYELSSAQWPATFPGGSAGPAAQLQLGMEQVSSTYGVGLIFVLQAIYG